MTTTLTRISRTWDASADLLIHYRAASCVPDYADPRDSWTGGHTTEVVHHGYGDAPTVVSLMLDDAGPDAVVAEIRRLIFAARDAAAAVNMERQRRAEEAIVAYTPNGRQIRKTATGRYEVQPHNDNYWITCDSVEEALDAYEHPERLGTARY